MLKTFKYGLLPLFFVLVSLPLTAQDAADPLIQAYQREFVYLDNEIRLLENRIKEVENDGDLRLEAARLRLGELELQLLDMQNDVNKRNEELRILEEQESSSLDAYDTVVTVITQANSRLKTFSKPSFRESYGEGYKDLEEKEKLQMELQYVFDQSFELLYSVSSVHVEEGQFFLPNGKLEAGSLVMIGQIAAFGSGDSHGGTLAPAGGGRFHLVRDEYKGLAEDMVDGKMPETLPLFIFESLDNLVETGKGKTIRDTIEGGGGIGLVIIGLGLIALALIVLRGITLFKVNQGTDEAIVDQMVEEMEKKNFDKALELCGKIQGAMSRVLKATVNGLMHEPKKVEDTIAESVLNEQPALNRFRTAISVFAAVAPLLGLLGTVTGMIATFDIITLYGTGDPKLLSGGISEALVTTELGLIVAIPTLLIGNLLSTWADSINSNLEVSALRMVNAVSGFKGTEKTKKKKKKKSGEKKAS